MNPAMILLGAAILLTGCHPREAQLARYKTVGDFSLTDQNGEPFDPQDLDGKIWVADFFFAGCATECIALSYRMNKIQRLLQPYTNVVLVSFTVDPRSDTPKALRRYADRFEAQPDKWSFLTGNKEVIYRTITESFLLPVAESPEERLQLKGGFIHSNKIAVVDAQGTVRAYFDGLVLSTPDAVKRTVQQLLKESPAEGAPSPPPKS